MYQATLRGDFSHWRSTTSRPAYHPGARLLAFGVLLEIIEDGAAFVVGERRQTGLAHPRLHRLHLHLPHRGGQ